MRDLEGTSGSGRRSGVSTVDILSLNMRKDDRII
jgi:hypothetical protein